MRGKFQMVTDTATMCLYDLAALKHRAQDTSDWWSIPADELAEVNAGHCLFLNLGADGVYEVEWSLEDVEVDPERVAERGTVYHLQVPSGNVYLGAADDVSGGDLEPDESCEGVLFQLKPGNYACIISREASRIAIVMTPSIQGNNTLDELIRM
ncbi:hypothetical protein BK131_19435 [Paenibacillus amylolyticus]|uniref:Uncharacterized protein n=1 Tax=Paenibacillus amylolyticus TaxID=1451 RepID=A0A1R1BQK9_PAEAM|nr:MULTISPECIES: DUF6386 family protein [Paenibacillus]OMF12172.1 hypothetical protein BK131_19435 [Paenibacillus amylolyticus]